MNLDNKFFYKFLLSKKSNFVSHAISKIHNTYSTKHNRSKISISSITNVILSYFDCKKTILKKRDKAEILIISNLVSLDSLNKDLYFGNLDKILNKQKIKTIKAFRNFTDKGSTQLNKLVKNNNIIFSKRTNYIDELIFLFITFKEALIFIFLNKYYDIKRYINLKDFLSIISNLRLINQIEDLIKILNPKIIIFTYEGHAWERLLVNLCKKKYKYIATVGYQFSPIKNNQIGFFRELKKDYNPDYLATSGQKTLTQITKRINFTKIFKLGSPNFSRLKIKDKKTKDLLVALDSEPNELLRMTDFCINFARKNKEFKIILRLHPIYSNKHKLVKEILLKIEKIHNLKISNKSLEKDLQKSKYLLFTDTAICITCLSYNVVPIFFCNKFSKNIFNNNFPKKNIVRNNKDLKRILIKSNITRLTSYFKDYRDTYFEKFDINVLKNIIKEK